VKLKEIERLRAFAALLVLCVHWPPLQKFLPAMLADPWSGVDLFFVISGFVVTLSLVRLLPPLEGEHSFVDGFSRARPGLKTFYVRRFFRIMPAALAVALLVRLMTGVLPAEFGTRQEWLKEFLGFFGGVYNYMFAFGGGPWQLSVYWSLSVEEHFYLLLPVLFLVFRTTNKRLAAAAGVAMCSILSRAILHPADKSLVATSEDMYCSHNRFDSLMAGVALALVLGHLKSAAPALMPKNLMRWVVLPMALLLIGCLPAAAPVYVMHHIGFIALWMLSGLLVAYASLDRGYVLGLPGLGRVLELLGARSYALYLLHPVTLRLETGARKLWPKYAELAPDSDKPWVRVLVLFAGTLVAAEIVHRVVEKPGIRLGRRIVDADGHFALSRTGKRLLAAGLALVFVFYFRHTIMLALGPRDLARGKAVYQSSHPDDAPSPNTLVNGSLESERGAFTKAEEHPWEMIDLGSPTEIGAIRVYNRVDGSEDQQTPLEVQISDDNEHFETIATRHRVFTQAWPWTIHCSDIKARYVRLPACVSARSSSSPPRPWPRCPECSFRRAARTANRSDAPGAAAEGPW
jgi:peptidoglycan/LPS O-acetylase OafA/YrhL